MTRPAEPSRPDPARPEPARRTRRRRRLFTLLALIGSALGARLLARRWARHPVLPPQGWGRRHHYLWRGDEVHFQQLGDGSPVVLVHSLGPGHDSGEWHRTAELLAADLDLLAPDLPGWGHSAATLVAPRPRLYVDFLGDFLVEVVRHPAVLVAAGASAPYAVAAAAALGPERLRGLALVTPHGLADPMPPQGRHLLERAAAVPLLGELALQGLTTRRAIRHHLESDVFAAPERADAAREEAWFRAARRPGARRALLAYLTGGLAFDVAELLPRLAVPVWLAWGRHAPPPGVEAADLWLQRLPAADLDVFEGCGALPHLEVPVAFTRKLHAFVQRLPS
jgi:pimeloyl-ACP methyl ester carboxylesterase